MSDYGIEISPGSKVVIFQGSVKKAPQLNKRGRKKWKERFCVLRANKSLECFKSKKALESSKAPRKVIDLRECINLEVGLEYKELQHILSLGTFKRTFFFAAPSDALMLQWVDNIEKVKNAHDGDRIRILDIGLRKSPLRTVSSMTTSQSLSKLAAFSSSNPALNQIGSHSSVSALGHITKLNPDLLPHQTRSPSLPPRTYSIDSPTSCDSDVDTSPKRSRHSQGSRQRADTHDGTSPSHQRGHYYVNVSPRPPPGSKKGKKGPVKPDHKDVTSQSMPKKSDQTRGSVPSDVLGKIPPPKIATRQRKDSVGGDENNPFSVLMQKQGVQSIQENLNPLELSTKSQPDTVQPLDLVSSCVHKPSIAHGMKRSFRYRKISLKNERPLLNNVQEEVSSDEEDEISETQERLLYSKKELAKSSPNLSEIGRPRPGRCRNAIRPSLNPCPSMQGTFQPFYPSYNPYKQTSYSKITVVGVKVQNCSSNIPNCDRMQKSVSPVPRPESLRNSNSEGTLCSSRPGSNYLPPPPPMFDTQLSDSEDFVLPDRHPSDTFMNCETISITSLDDIVVDPPEMFEDTSLSPPDEEKIEIESNENKSTSKMKSECEPEVPPNRNSTESCDTGYNSSPSYHQRTDTGEEKWGSDEGSPLPTTTEKHCIPIIFYTNNVWRPRGRGKGLLGLQVCLVEQGSGVIEDLLSLKEIEGYTLIECEEHGPSSVTTPSGDILTVETSLQDLEFGFSVVKSTQKDLFNRRVKEFDFEVRNLFSSNKKPFSCEIHIKHASEVLVLPVELS